LYGEIYRAEIIKYQRESYLRRKSKAGFLWCQNRGHVRKKSWGNGIWGNW
jgi:hypothetical protein